MTDWEEVLVVASGVYITVMALIASPVALLMYVFDEIDAGALSLFVLAFAIGVVVLGGATLVMWAFSQGREALSAAIKGVVKFYAAFGPLLVVFLVATSQPSKYTIIALLLLWILCLALFYYMDEN